MDPLFWQDCSLPSPPSTTSSSSRSPWGFPSWSRIMETLYVRTGNEVYKRMTKFWGKLFLINFAMGVVTGIVQEFQFGMNWSEYSRFVGDIFGAPAGDRSAAGLLPRIDLPGRLDLWLGSSSRKACTPPPSGWWRSARTSRRCGS